MARGVVLGAVPLRALDDTVTLSRLYLTCGPKLYGIPLLLSTSYSSTYTCKY